MRRIFVALCSFTLISIILAGCGGAGKAVPLEVPASQPPATEPPAAAEPAAATEAPVVPVDLAGPPRLNRSQPSSLSTTRTAATSPTSRVGMTMEGTALMEQPINVCSPLDV